MAKAAGLNFREAGPADGPVALLVHGFPESSYMWRHLLPALAGEGWRAIAPDLPGSGDSPPGRPQTWERQVDALERFRQELALPPVVLVVHDWGGLIGLRWACDNPGATRALVISDTGFFPDGKWHGMAEAMRTEGEGEQFMDNVNRDLLAMALRQTSSAFDDEAMDEYWKGFADEDRRHGHLDLYRSGDFEKLHAYRGKLAELNVPALMVWGEKDEFAPPAGAYRFRKELPGSEVVVVEEAGHFVWEDAPEAANHATLSFLGRLAG